MLSSTMATICLTLSSSSSLLPISKTKINNLRIPKRFVSYSLSPLSWFSTSFLHLDTNKTRVRVSSPLAVLNEEPVVAEEINGKEENAYENESESENDNVLVQNSWNRARPCEVYVCNLPRSCDIPELLEMFQPFGPVLSIEISRNVETLVSRGCGFVTMGSINSAKNAIVALDRSDVGGREMRVKFSVEMNSWRNPEVLNSPPKKSLVYESPNKIYVGNLDRAVTPEDLRNYFSQFGTVVSAKVLHDRREGKSRVFGFLSFSTAAERDAALAVNGSDFCGRSLVVREGVERIRQT